MPDKRLQLALARRDEVFVSFTRPFEQGSVIGYVLDVGPDFFLIALVTHGLRFDGYQCLRLSDVRQLEVPGRNHAFVEAALKKRGQRIPRKPPVVLRTLHKLLLTANQTFSLVTIHRERVNPDVCQIGRVVHLNKGYVWLLEIGSDGVWDGEPETYRLSEITRVDFGGDYEDALFLVGGAPIANSLRRRDARKHKSSKIVG
jgi:hypothetical protein